ncbi:hypothetical protein [Microbacterium phyllosphaerae]|uniref:hypothetical protein n=1 Tax=Microbacterium phyllosphaerae TaxID=124798 RepID=UPI000EA32893|nr:hypothetical protein [Microbacterium phyllosphaerae]
MSISDEDLDRLFRAANPARDSGLDSLRAQDIAVRESIIRGTYSPTHQRRPDRAWGRFAVAVASIAVIAIVAVNVLASDQRAVALTPPPLQYDNAEPLQAVIDDARQRLESPDQIPQQPHVTSLSWGWNIDIATERVEVVPQITTFDWSTTAGSTNAIVAGKPYWAEGQRPDSLDPSPYSPGDVIAEYSVAPEDLDIPADVVALNGSTREDLARALAALGVSAEATSGELLVGIGLLQSYWTLTDEQHATLIDMLVDAGGVTVLGETRDRLGRDVVGLRVSEYSDHYEDTVLISLSTGRIVGMENELTVAQDFIPEGVVGYTLWDVE